MATDPMITDPMIHASAGCVAALMAAAAAAAGAFLVRGSTAVPAAWWGVAACLGAAGDFAWRTTGGLDDPAGRSIVRLAVVALSLCPIMSILGAKRPQHGVWQFIVASLAVVLALPAIAAAVVRPGTPPDVHLLERGFVLVLLLVGWLNFVATRHWLAATLVSAGQLLWARAFLPFGAVSGEPFAWPDTAAALLVALGAITAAIQSAVVRSRRDRLRAFDEPAAVPPPLRDRVEPALGALRETLGVAWTLRIAERFNAVATERGWPWRLRSGGLDAADERADAAMERAAERTLRGLMLRFVTAAWLARHRWN